LLKKVSISHYHPRHNSPEFRRSVTQLITETVYNFDTVMTSKTLLSSGKSSKEHDKIAYIKTALFLARNHQPLYIKIPNPVQVALSDRGQCTRDPVQVHKKSHGQKEIFVGDDALPVAPVGGIDDKDY
jgi:hypothetical protein